MTGVDLLRRAGELTRHGRPAPSRWDRLTMMARRTAVEMEKRRRVERRRRQLRRVAMAGVVIGAGAAVVLARAGLSPGNP